MLQLLQFLVRKPGGQKRNFKSRHITITLYCVLTYAELPIVKAVLSGTAS